ncbi:AmmeMemoRadiSam system protein B [Candidatus Absconditicoccus praedator]|uniref:AmmeMemoRadiSam system protein B n=1 Tax=Candidatus Absconditicoccus praedator TaxID=2735562 RepID=UPI001E4375A8|nr:AmmeMemoRadiSam system protein B [Candidatus Absconditicoccus praedator]UFX83382.1 AmmeMemoRadiSam system protein B [Candidatus Absconditicoccus praedator]
MVKEVFYPTSPQILHEMVVSLTVSVQSFVDENLSVHPKIALVPNDYYIYSGAVMASAYSALSKNKDIKEIIVVGRNSDKSFTGYGVPSFGSIKNILGEKKVSSRVKQLLDEYKDFHGFDNDEMFSNIDCQMPFVLSTFNINSLLPVIVGRTNKYIKLVNFLSEAIKEKHVAVIISSNISNTQGSGKIIKKDSKQAQAIVQNNLRDLPFSGDSSNILLRIFSSVCKKRGYDINPLIYSNSSDFDKDSNISRGYFSMIGGIG